LAVAGGHKRLGNATVRPDPYRLGSRQIDLLANLPEACLLLALYFGEC
jgi:hypothetical protein